jgi:hypothetical protein
LPRNTSTGGRCCCPAGSASASRSPVRWRPNRR